MANLSILYLLGNRGRWTLNNGWTLRATLRIELTRYYLYNLEPTTIQVPYSFCPSTEITRKEHNTVMIVVNEFVLTQQSHWLANNCRCVRSERTPIPSPQRFASPTLSSCGPQRLLFGAEPLNSLTERRFLMSFERC